MLKNSIDHVNQRERVLSEFVRSVGVDLKLIDAGDLVGLMKTGQMSAVESLVQCSAELTFKQGTLGFGSGGDIEMSWEQPPSVSLDMEFHHNEVHVYFRLLLSAFDPEVQITYITFDGNAASPETNTQRLLAALIDARIPSCAVESARH